MTFTLVEVNIAADFDVIWPVHFQAFRDPYNSFSKFTNPVHTTLDAAIEASKTRHIRMWDANRTACHWTKVTETETGQIVGAACWHVNETGYAQGDAKMFRETFKAKQHIEGSDEKRWAEKLIGGFKSAVMENTQGAHVELEQMIVHPEYRYQGVAKLLTRWGTNIADERNIETVVVAVPYAQPVYEKLGFEVLKTINIDFSVPTPSKKWKEWQAEDMRAFLMVRPLQKSATSTSSS